MTWPELGNLVIVLTLIGIAIRLAKGLWDTFQAITGFFKRQELHMIAIQDKLDETISWFKEVWTHESK